MGLPQKFKNRAIAWSSISTLGYIFTRIRTRISGACYSYRRVSIAFVEAPTWVPRTHVGWHTSTCNSNCGGYSALFWPWSGTLFLCIYTLHIHRIKNRIQSWKQNLRCLRPHVYYEMIQDTHIRKCSFASREKFYHLHPHRWIWRTFMPKAISWSLKAQCCWTLCLF